MSEAILSQVDSSTAAAQPPESFNPSQAAEQSPFVPPSWAKGMNIDEEILKAPVFNNVKSTEDIVKSYYHAQKLIGADKIAVPNKNSTAEQWKEYYVKAGLPAGIEDYKAELPPSMDNQDFNKKLVEKAYEMNVRPDQLAGIAAEMEKFNDQIVAEYENTQKQELTQTAEGLKKEWGQDFQRNLAQVQKTIEHFGGKEALDSILESPLANDGTFLRLINKISSKLNREDTFSQDVVESFGLSAADAKNKINDIFADPKHPYYDSNSPKHKQALEDMLRYQKIIAN